MRKFIITEVEINAILHNLKQRSSLSIQTILKELEEIKEDEHTRIQEEDKTGE